MYQFSKRRSNQKTKRGGSNGFPEGLNTLGHPSAIKETELSELINGIYSQYGTISKRQGSFVIGSASENGTKILNLAATYKVDGKDRMIRISDTGKPEYYNFDTETWSLLTDTAPSGYAGSTPTFTDGCPAFNTTVTTSIVQTYGKIFFANSEDDLVWLDEDGWHIYTAIANPTTKASIAKTGSATGTVTYFYTYVDYNEAGGTLSAPLGEVGVDADGTGYKANMPQVLDSSTYLTITIPAAPAGTTRRAIFKGTREDGMYYLADLTPTQTTYVDKNEIAASDLFMIPEDNTTKGLHFYLLDTFKGSLVGVSKEYGRDVFCWSGADDKYMSFGIPDGAGYLPYSKGDGTYINAIKGFSASNEDSFFLFKDKMFGKFKFDIDGGASIQNINMSVGSISRFSPHSAGNNLRFWSEEGAASVGNEANYGTILRYSVLSLKADTIAQQVTAANIPNVCGIYYKHLSLFGISTEVGGSYNSSCLVYDERYNAWSLWTGIYASMFCKFITPTKEEKLYYGSGKDANVVEMFRGKTDYATSTGSGTKITLSITTKQYDMGIPDAFKKYEKVTIVFGSLFGNKTTIGITRADHKGIHNDPRLAITSDPTLSGFGNDEWGNQEFGMMSEDDEGVQVPLKYINLKQKDMYWIKVNIQNDGTEDEISILGIYVYYTGSTRPLPFSTKLNALASA